MGELFLVLLDLCIRITITTMMTIDTRSSIRQPMMIPTSAPVLRPTGEAVEEVEPLAIVVSVEAVTLAVSIAVVSTLVVVLLTVVVAVEGFESMYR